MTENNQPNNENSSTHEGPTNFYLHTKKAEDMANPNYMRNHVFEVPFRAAIIAASGAGKTNTILNILNRMSGTFTKVVLCIPTPEEPLYDLLKDKLKDKLEIFTGEIKKGIRKNKCAMPNIPPIDEVAEKDLDGFRPKLMIFDDLLLYPDQSDIETYYIRGRKKGISSIYASQSFYKIPITIRRNCRYFILKRNVNASDLKKIFNLCSFEIKFPQFIQMYRECTSNMEDFLVLDIEKCCIFRNFETTPLYSTYEFKEKAKELADNASEEHKQFPPEQRQYSTTNQDSIIRDMMMESYLQILDANRVGVPVCLDEIHEKYSQYCTDNNMPIATKHLLSRRLGARYEKRKGRDCRVYFLI